MPPDADLFESKQASATTKSIPTLSIAKAEVELAQAQLQAVTAQVAADNWVLRDQGEASVQPNKTNEDLVAVAGRKILKMQLAEAKLEILKASEETKAAAIKRRDAALKAIADDATPGHTPLRGSQRALDQKTHKASQYSPVYPQTSTGRRTALANWITHRDNPLTARVAVNHIWDRHFGTPLVDTVFDFGRRAPKPLHHGLLDFLAIELIESDWSMKHIHRMILTSKAWQRSSSNLDADTQTLTADPQNRFYWRMNSRRMESQALRDSLLLLSGRLDLTVGGPPSKPSPDMNRRSLYLFHSRQGRDKFVSTFDDAGVLSCYRRTASVVPQQAALPDQQRDSIEAARLISARIGKSSGKSSVTNLTDKQFAEAAFELLIARTPSAAEKQVCFEMLSHLADRVQFVHVLLNHNDFQVIR